jgi:hypothetical protein
MRSTTASTQAKILTASLMLAGLVSAVFLYKYSVQNGRTKSKSKKLLLHDDDDDDIDDEHNSSASPNKETSFKNGTKNSSDTPKHSNKSPESSSAVAGDKKSVSDDVSAEALSHKLEVLDKRAKELFRAQKFMDAAEVYTEALDLIQSRNSNGSKGSSRTNFDRQMTTLLNNRCAMYEKGGFADLALIGACMKALRMVLLLVF